MRRRFFHLTAGGVFVLALVLVALAYPGQESVKTANTTDRRIAQKLPARGIPNFGQVSPTLYRGAQPSPEGIEALKKMGVEIVVDLRGSASTSERAAVTKLGMQYVSIPSHCPFPTDEPWAHFLALVKENPAKKIFVHCRLGDDRTGIAVATYRMTFDGWNAKEAMNEMKAFGFSGVHHVICPGLEEYEKSFPKRLNHNGVFERVRPQPGPVGTSQ